MLPDTSHLIVLALAEDFGARGDVTTAALIPPDAVATAHFVNRKAGVVAGLEIIGQVFEGLKKFSLSPAGRGYREAGGEGVGLLPPSSGLRPPSPRWGEGNVVYHVEDGDHVPAQTRLATVTGSTAAILTAERTALNFVSRLSGIATATRELQQKIKHTKAKVCDTRKTTPGWRALEKYAVKCGGGENHRMGLYDMVMIKDNHIAAVGDISAAVARAQEFSPDVPIAVEVENLDQLRAALNARADRIMLDNMSVELMREAVQIAAGKAVIEATGGVTADNIVAIAETGVDFISSGWITHSAPILDIGLDFAEKGA